MMLVEQERLRKEFAFREALIAGFAIRGNVTFNLYDAACGNRDTNRMFALWESLDARINHQHLKLGNNWRNTWTRSRWIVVMERKKYGHKHLHGMVSYENAQEWKAAFDAACEKEKKSRLDGWTWCSEVITEERGGERGWIDYMLTSASERNYETDRFDFRVSKNCAVFRNQGTSQ